MFHPRWLGCQCVNDTTITGCGTAFAGCSIERAFRHVDDHAAVRRGAVRVPGEAMNNALGPRPPATADGVNW